MFLRRCLALLSAVAIRSAAIPLTDTIPGYGSSSESTVDLGYTSYQGTALPAGVSQYLGMRYAAPPLGDLRWRAPADPLPSNSSTTVHNATDFGPLCLGTGDGSTSPHSEDCLYINVYTPTTATQESKLPVWLYIQGGGYASNSNANYNGTQAVLASNQSIVLVNFNYRVGAWGFLSSEEVRADGDLNVGLLDQRKAMGWVQKHISKFGGDPEHVVIHGASAGAGSVAFHLSAYGGRDDGLFVGAIPESPFWPVHRTVAQTEWQFERLVANVSCSAAPDAMACLRSKSTTELQASNVASPYPVRAHNPLWYFTPVVDGNLSRDLLYNAFAEGKIIKVPLLVGDDTNEGSLFSVNASTSEQSLEFLKDNYPGLTNIDLQKINASYPLMPPLPGHAAWFPSSSAAYGDSTFTCPGNQMSASMARSFSPNQVFNYHFDAAITANILAGLGVSHTIETPAIFGPPNGGCTTATTNSEEQPVDPCSFDTYNAPLVPLVMDYYLSFVKTLNPNPLRSAGSPEWQPWGPRGDVGRRLRVSLNATSMESVPQEQAERCALWRGLAARTQQ